MGLIRVLMGQVEQHMALQLKDASNYEDIYYLARQLLDALLGEYDNPALLPLLLELQAKVPMMVANLNSSYGRTDLYREPVGVGLQYLLERALLFIEEAVAQQLAMERPIVGLALLDELLNLDAENPLHIVTLNHDTLLERHLAKYGIADGFVQMSTGAERFDALSFEGKPASRVRLLKPHGSINWFRYKAANESDLAVKVLSNDRDRVKGSNGEDLMPPVERLLLAGTTNKELAYGSGIFLELMYQFHRRLTDTNLLIVSGYGFADKGINNRLWAWLDSRPENRMLVLHAKMEELHRKAKPSFSINLKRHKETGKFAYVDKWLRDTTLDDISR